MEKRLLLTRSRHDIANQYLYAYSEEIIAEADSLGWKTDRVENEKNQRKEVESRLTKSAYDFVFFNGHGTDESVSGHGDEKLVDAGSASILKDKIVFARSCSALNTLGKEAVKKGCKAFIGYNGLFFISYTNEYQSTPLKDPTARPVMEVSNLAGKLILKGDTVQTAVEAAQRKAGDLILKMLASKEPYDAGTFRALYQNYMTFSFTGDGQAKA
ncbi:Uncharacterised protein [Candidatus Gugararchaeum adminiculabundum]|nr:Uncharacterised protein [Candidatus Gugararchaeum adminiculabundum]